MAKSPENEAVIIIHKRRNQGAGRQQPPKSLKTLQRSAFLGRKSALGRA